MKRLDVLFALTALAAGTVLPVAHAADPSPPPPPPPVARPAATATGADVSAELAAARTAIRAQNWAAAMQSLRAATAKTTTNADVYNLLGFSTRKSGDVPGGMAHYATALRLDPNHKGALEYQGEGFLQLGQLDRAEANLARLQTVCGNKTCEEYEDLAKAVAAFKRGDAAGATKK